MQDFSYESLSVEKFPLLQDGSNSPRLSSSPPLHLDRGTDKHKKKTLHKIDIAEIPSIQDHENQLELQKEFATKFPALIILLRILFLLPPKTLATKIIFLFIQGVILCLCMASNIVSLILFDTLKSAKAAEGSHLLRILVAYVFLATYLKKNHFQTLVWASYSRDAKYTTKLVNRYLLVFAIISLVSLAGSVPLLMDCIGESRCSGKLFWAVVASRVLFAAIWSASLVILWIIIHLLGNNWRRYLASLTGGNFQFSEALSEHAKLTEELSITNQLFEFFLVFTLATLLGGMVASIYLELQPHPRQFWLVQTFLDVGYFFGVCGPGAVVTTLARRVKKRVNKLRTIVATEDEKSAKEVDSFLIYLLTNNASFKVAGVGIDLGFLTKLTIAVFTVCAFMVQRELSHG